MLNLALRRHRICRRNDHHETDRQELLPEPVKVPLRVPLRMWDTTVAQLRAAYENPPERSRVAGLLNLACHRYNLRQPPFDILPQAIGPWVMKVLVESLERERSPPTTGQSGAVLDGMSSFAHYLKPLEESVSARYRCRMYLRFDRSSYQVQPPDGVGKLELHQDYDALRELRRELFTSNHFMSHPPDEPCCTVWVPLTDIDEETPTLQLSPRVPDEYLEHRADPAGYAIIDRASAYEDWPMVTISQLRAGDGVIFGPLTLHRSFVRPWHTKTRRSFDLRFTAYPPPSSGL
jgi:hypothetical protein